MDINYRLSRNCLECKNIDNDEFHKVLDLKNSGLVVYVHKPEESLEDKKLCRKKNEYYILHNIRHKDLKRPDFITELCQYRTKCFRCKTIIQKVRSLLDEIWAIRGNEVLGICGYCKKANPAGKCRRCLYIINKFYNNKAKQNEDRQIKFRTWLGRVQEFLELFMIEGEYCSFKMHPEGSAAELQNLLEKLKMPLTMHEPDIELFTTADAQTIISQNKEMLEELVSKLKYGTEERFMSSFHTSPKTSNSTCVCKHLRENKFLSMPPLIEIQENIESIHLKETDQAEDTKQVSNIAVIENKSFDRREDLKFALNGKVKSAATDGVKIKKISSKEKGNTDKENRPPKEPKELNPPKERKTQTESKLRKESLSPEEKLMLKIMKQREQQEKQTAKPAKKATSMVLPKFEDLPPLKVHEVVVLEKSSEGILECGDKRVSHPAEMVKGIKLVKYGPRANDDDHSLEPMLFKTHPVCPEPVVVPPSPVPTPIRLPTSNMKKQKQKDSGFDVEINTKGLTNYVLSNRNFIDKGWTQLPTTKIMRRIYIYKMIPANPKYDWFKINKLKRLKFYDTGEKLAEIDVDGCGRWYYKNKAIALDYYNAEKLNAGQRYVIYSSGEEMDGGKLKPYPVLASFDYLGNGVVYDHYGNMRLKYNQSEGVVIDSKIGPPGRWKWHTLNDPPMLQPAFFDTRERHPSPRIRELIKSHKDDVTPLKVIDQKMLSIELDNFLKEKEQKLRQKFKPFQIRSKVLKLNDKFTLSILDQSNIYLRFRDGPMSLKLNLGMVLLNDEIIDTDTTDVTEVATPYDRHPPTTRSVANIQIKLGSVKKMEKAKGIRV